MAHKQFNSYRIEGEIAYILIESEKYGKFEAMVDKEDLQRVYNLGKWSIAKYGESSGFYAVKRGNVRLHRVVMNLDKEDKRVVDHIDGNTLDNRKSNLRVVEQSLNCKNVHKMRNNTSGKIGVNYENTVNNRGIKVERYCAFWYCKDTKKLKKKSFSVKKHGGREQAYNKACEFRDLMANENDYLVR